MGFVEKLVAFINNDRLHLLVGKIKVKGNSTLIDQQLKQARDP
jgi:hypothetical protein